MHPAYPPKASNLNMSMPHVGRLLVTLKKALPAVLLLALLSLVTAPVARAQMTLDFVEVGADVMVTYSGAWATASSATGNLTSAEGRANSLLILQGAYAYSGNMTDNIVGFTAGSAPWTSFNGTSVTGDNFGFDIYRVYGPSEGYTSATTISGSMTVTAKTLSGIGLTTGTSGVMTSLNGGNVINWSAGPSVPEPSIYAAIFGAIALIGTIGIRRRSKQSAAQ